MQTSFCFVAKKTSDSINIPSLTDNEKELGFSLVWMSFEKALEVMLNSFEVCNDYSMRFMLLRDRIILENAQKIIKQML